MKIGLIDIDSKIPNLALMKISAYYKLLENEVTLTSPLFADQFDRCFASKIFDYTDMPILPKTTQVGGSGIHENDEKKLDPHTEHLMPDYSLYDCKYAIGFTSRGCNRKCPFCIVPKKEGKWSAVADIYEFWDGQEKIMLLDSSINTNENHFLMICDQIKRNNIHVDFSQGLDIRYLTDIQAMFLGSLKLWKRIHFAWDNIHDEVEVRLGIKILKKYKLNYVSFYVLIGFNSSSEEDMYRVKTLRELDVDSFVMPYNKFDKYQQSFTRWVNHKAIFKSVKWKDYKYGI